MPTWETAHCRGNDTTERIAVVVMPRQLSPCSLILGRGGRTPILAFEPRTERLIRSVRAARTIQISGRLSAIHHTRMGWC
jgi:hypothetical protein